MKIAEQFIDGEGDTFHVKNTFDPNPTLNAARVIRDAQVGQTGEKRHVARIPGWLIQHWLKEAGVAHNDHQARADIIRKKVLSGEVNAFRNWMGTF